MDGKFDGRMTVDVFQTGSGTGINMNVNEVIAERAVGDLRDEGPSQRPGEHGPVLERRGPHSHPGRGRFARTQGAAPEPGPRISRSLSGLAEKTSSVYKSGRTHLRDAMPVTMGQEFGAYADAFAHDRRLVSGALRYVRELPIGGTAVGTGINTSPRFGKMVVGGLNKATGLGFSEAGNRFRAMRLLSDLVALSSALKVTALDLYRLCQDLRLDVLRAAHGAGRDRPATTERGRREQHNAREDEPGHARGGASRHARRSYGLDQANQLAGMLGEFELSMGVPLMGYNVNLQLKLLSEALRKVSSLVLADVVPNKARLRSYAERSPSLITVISPAVGYDKASAIGKKLSARVLDKGRTEGDGIQRQGDRPDTGHEEARGLFIEEPLNPAA